MFILIILLFLLVRTFLALEWNDGLYKEALLDIHRDKDESWYNDWDPVISIFSPIHFNKWTTKQWIKYLKPKNEV